jgi:hypothetical protein
MASILYKMSTSGDVTELEGGSRLLGRLMVLPPSHYSLHRQKLRRTDRIGRQAAEQKLVHDYEYKDHVFLTDTSAQTRHSLPSMTWVWPRSPTSNPRFKNIAALPEPLCRDPMNTGVRIVIGLEGYFGEIWWDRQLVSIRWWPDIPTQRQWEEFVRASGVQAHPDGLGQSVPEFPPEPIHVPFRKDLVFGGADWPARFRQFRPQALLLPAISVLLAGLLFESGQAVAIQSSIYSRAAILERQQADAAEWLPFRRSALSMRDDVARLMETQESIAIVYALTDLSYALKDQGTTIRAIDLVDNRLSVSFEKPGLSSPVKVIEALEQSMSWQVVSYDNNRQQITGQVTMGLVEQARSSGTPTNE